MRRSDRPERGGFPSRFLQTARQGSGEEELKCLSSKPPTACARRREGVATPSPFPSLRDGPLPSPALRERVFKRAAGGPVVQVHFLMVTSVTLFTRLLARTQLPSRVTEVLRTMLP